MSVEYFLKLAKVCFQSKMVDYLVEDAELLILRTRSITSIHRADLQPANAPVY